MKRKVLLDGLESAKNHRSIIRPERSLTLISTPSPQGLSCSLSGRAFFGAPSTYDHRRWGDVTVCRLDACTVFLSKQPEG